MDRECWLEIDLYWFQGDSARNKVEALFDRLLPLWNRSAGARKGLSICVGWLFDMVLDWNGEIDATIPCCQPPTYEAWSYRRLRALVSEIHAEAARRQLLDFHVGLLLMGIETQSFPESDCVGWSGRTERKEDKVVYDIEGRWFPQHPEVKDPRFDSFFFGAPVRVPEAEAICRDPSCFGEYFADKLVSVTTAVGLDAVVLRDHIFTKAYVRGYSKGRYMAPEARDAWNAAIIAMLGRVKSQNPELVLIGYGSGTSSMEEWRSHGFDLEKVARSGHLDLWITQTWASAWGDYWPAHAMGFTFQLANALVDQVKLAGTPCKHLFLIETFDAWEPWDSIHQYPSKVTWEIWAYSHAAVRMPGGRVSRSAGCYLSWMNRRGDLLPQETLERLVGDLGAASDDLARDPVPGGPTIVFGRRGLDASLREPAEQSRGEEMDDWSAMLLKFGTPILSITRSEWLPGLDLDGLVFPLPYSLDDSELAAVVDCLERAKPVLLMGNPAWIDERLRARLGIWLAKEPATSPLPTAAVVEECAAESIGTAGLVIDQRCRTLTESPQMRTLISCLGGPVLARAQDSLAWVWETPEWGTPHELHLTNRSIQSPQTYVLVADQLGSAGWGGNSLRWRNDDWTKPVCFLFWRYSDGRTRVLLANLEMGVTGNSQFCISGRLNVPVVPVSSALGAPGRLRIEDGTSSISLGPHRASLCELSEARD